MAQTHEGITKPIPASYCISPMEYKLYNMINDYRRSYDLPPIPLSKSLCYVASTHVNDLFFHHPDQGSCNAHSWSNQGNWKPFCYPRDENKKNSVWDKPEELTPYRGKGYEIVYWENDAAVIDSIITLWKSMDYFNSFLMNTGKWQGKKWNAIGIGIHENYACAWFGEVPDPEGEPFICGQVPQNNSSVHKVPVIIEKKKPEQKDLPLKKVQPDVQKKVPPPNPKVVSAIANTGITNYYIIVKGVAPEKELQHFLKDLQIKGYSSSQLVEKNGKQRVSIMEFQEKSKADSALRQVKKTWQDAWILEK
jgi:nitrogen regulatory protein PII-like uncharacterized protein